MNKEEGGTNTRHNAMADGQKNLDCFRYRNDCDFITCLVVQHKRIDQRARSGSKYFDFIPMDRNGSVIVPPSL
jgi:hypothetical protein